MAGYVFPEEWRLLGIDPVVAMLVGKRMDQREDPDAIAGLMEKYAMWVNYEYMVRVRQQQQREQQLEHPQQVEQPQGLQANQNQTYTELQTVRGSSDATEVLQSHNRRQEQEEQPQVVESSEAEDSVSVPSVESAEISRDARMRVKEEVVEVPSVSSPLAEPRSVIPTSVLPAPPSVAEIPRNMPGLGTIGVKGEKRVLVSYEGCAVGPIRVETEDQVKHPSTCKSSSWKQFLNFFFLGSSHIVLRQGEGEGVEAPRPEFDHRSRVLCGRSACQEHPAQGRCRLPGQGFHKASSEAKRGGQKTKKLPEKESGNT